MHKKSPRLNNPCTLVPTDFQLYRKMKQILFSFFVFLCSKKTKLDCYFRFSFFPRREGNGIRIHFMFSNPCTLVPTDFQLHRKITLKFCFRFSLQWKNEIGLPFSFFIFPRQKEKKIKIHFMLSVFLFLWLKKRILIFFFVFRFSVEFWKQITIRFWFFCFQFMALKLTIFVEGDMGGSEYRNTANKIEQIPHHRNKYCQHTDTARFTWSNLFFKKNVITVTSTFQTQETHHKTFLPKSPHVNFLAVAYTSLGDTKMSQRSYCCQLIRQCFR